MAPLGKLVSSAVLLMMVNTAVAVPIASERRQIGGEATALYGIVNNVDNGSGYFAENLEDGVANGLNPGSGGDTEYGQNMDGSSSAPGPSGPPPPSRMSRVRRQGNKVANGLGPVVEDLGQQGVGQALETMGDQEDGTLTEGAGDLGTTTGDIEEGSLSEAGYGIGQVAGDVIQEAKGAKAPAAPAGPGAV